MTSAVIGIDIGSYSCYLSVARKGGIETLLNEYSERCTPSCISFNNKTRFIGNSANMQLVTNPKNTINYFVPLIGKKFSDNVLQMELPYLNYRVIEDDKTIAIEAHYLSHNYRFKPEQLIAMLFSKLKSMAMEQLHLPVTQAVINVPEYYTVTERLAFISALHIAGIDCATLINDLSAVGLIYHVTRFQSLTQSKVVAFVDVGYTNFQASIIRFNKDRFHVILSTYEVNLGGREFDRTIYNYLAKSFKENYSIDILDSSKASIRVMNEAEKVKKRLSANAAEFAVGIECLMNDQDVSAKIDRSLFEKLSGSLVKRMHSCLTALVTEYHQKFTNKNNVPLEPISCVELVGGSSRIPAVKQVVADAFKMEPQITLNADEAVSRGCAIKSAMLNSNCVIRHVDFYDSVPYSISLETFTHESASADSLLSSVRAADETKKSTMIQESFELVTFNQAYPLSASIEFTECKVIEIKYTDRNQIPNDNKIIGYIKINQEPSQDKLCKLHMDYSFNQSGLFIVDSLTLMRNSKSPRSNNQQVAGLSQDKAGSPTPNPMGINQETNGKKKTGGKTHKSSPPNYDVLGPVDFQLQYLLCVNEPVLNHMQKMEMGFIKKDGEETERLNLKNRLEESIYKYRDNLNAHSEKGGNKQEIESLLGKLNQLENWLFEEGEDETKETYKENLKKLDAMMKDVTKSSKRQINLSNASEVLGQFLKEAEAIVAHLSSTTTTANSEQVDNSSNISVQDEIQKLHSFINQGHEVYSNMDSYLQSENELIKFLEDFQDQLNVNNQLGNGINQ